MSKWTHPNTSKVIESEEQKMSEYQLEMMMDLSDEEFMDYMRSHKRKINKKEIETDGEESNYDFYC